MSNFSIGGDAYTQGYCGRCGRVRTHCQRIIETGMCCTDRRLKPRGTGTLARVLDITYNRIRNTEAQNEQASTRG